MSFDFETYALENLERSKRTTTGQIVSVCPWCGKYGSFYVNASEGHYLCFRCEEKGRYLIGVIAKVENINWYEAKKYLIKKLLKRRRKETTKTLYEKIISFRKKDDDCETEKIKVDLPKEFIPVFSKKRNKVWKFPKYLSERNIERETAKFWNLGFCNSGRYFNRLIIPIVCDNGNSFTARDVTKKLKPKYLNPKGVDQGKLLFGWNKIDKESDLVIVEGPFDVIKLWQHGYQSLSLGGKILHSEQIKLLLTLPKDISITLMLDPEESVAPYDVAENLIFHFENIYIAKLKNGIDPGSSTKKQADFAYNKAIPYNGDKLSKITSKFKSLENFYF